MENCIKRALRVALAGASLVSVLLTSTCATNYKTTNRVYLREKPNTDSAVVKIVKSGGKVIGVRSSKDGEWLKVTYGEKEGYIYKKFLKEIDTPVVNNLIVSTPEETPSISSGIAISDAGTSTIPSISSDSNIGNISVPNGSIFHDTGNPGGTSLGRFMLTFYCGCVSCSEGYGTNTATGATCTQGRTIAVDPTVIPYGTKVYIEGYGVFVAEDCGGAIKGNHIDIYVEDHALGDRLGVKYANVTIVG